MDPVPASRSATFLITDIEGSTRLWETEPGPMAAALATHDALLREAVERAGGVVFKTTGDGMLAAFDGPAAAIEAAVAAQRAIGSRAWPTSRPLRVRMALHTGSAEMRDGDYFGPSLNRVARLLAIGHGGQVLVSAAAAAVAADDLAGGVELLDRGEHHLRDLSRVEHVYQLAGPGLAVDFPALKSGRAPTNLPAEATSFVGRERETAAVRALVDAHRLVSLVGVGGTGKTRLMLRVAGELAGRYPDGAWLVELAPVGDPALVIAEVSRALAIPDQPGRSPYDVVVDFLRDKELLLLVDNCEHLVEAAADVVERLLAACRSLRVMATSREALGVPGEAVFGVPSLGLPSGPDATDPAAVAACDAVRLFVDRATAVQPSFRLDSSTTGPVLEICRRLDGIPLALELAAARVNVLGAAEIASGLGDRFRLLAGGRRTSVARQQTLQAMIDWSWDLLGEADKVLLRRLSVFTGGWTLGAAADVTADTPGPAARLDTIDGLGRLVDRSLVVADHDGETRFRMLETIRQYASDRLLASGEAATLRTRHLSWCCRLTEAAAPALEGPTMLDWLPRIDAETDNIRTAFDWALEVDPESAVVMAASLGDYWRVRTVGPEGVERFATAIEALPRLGEPAPAERHRRLELVSRLLAKGAREAAMTSRRVDDAIGWADEAVRMARETGDPVTVSSALAGRMFVAMFSGGSVEDVLAMQTELVSVAEAAEDWLNLTYAAAGGVQSLVGSNPAEAEHWALRAVDWAERSQQPFALGLAALARGRQLGHAGDADGAESWFARSQAQFHALDDPWMELVARSDRAHALRRSGRPEAALAAYRDVLPAWQRIGHRGAVANLLECFSFLASASGDATRAATLLGAAERLRRLAHARLLPTERMELDAAAAGGRAALGDAAFEQAERDGASLSTEDAVALALS